MIDSVFHSFLRLTTSIGILTGQLFQVVIICFIRKDKKETGGSVLIIARKCPIVSKYIVSITSLCVKQMISETSPT